MESLYMGECTSVPYAAATAWSIRSHSASSPLIIDVASRGFTFLECQLGRRTNLIRLV